MKLGRFTRLTAVGAIALFLAGCATSGPTFMEMQTSSKPIAANSGRIYVYRTSALGAALQPSVKLDGMTVGDAVPEGYFFVDRPAGTYKLSTATEVDRTVSLTLNSGEVRYVRLDVSFGFFVGHISPVLVDTAEAEKEIQKLHFTGK
ncbi:MAG TPA: DUF2846 domain-containing protein [Micropepsaceae bacterium]|jgi:hypothetical protein|nr:DUF2846 domain-containing protein [Micropepsaceae bacterium]